MTGWWCMGGRCDDKYVAYPSLSNRQNIHTHSNDNLTNTPPSPLQGFSLYLLPSPTHFVSLSEYIYAMVRA